MRIEIDVRSGKRTVTHVLYLCPVGCIGGAERVLIECVRQCRRLRPDWRVSVLLFADGPLRETLSQLGARVEVLALPAALAGSGDARLTAAAEAKGRQTASRALDRVGSLSASVTNAAAFFKFLSQLRKSIDQISPDLIHSSGIKSHLCLATVRGPRRCPIVWHIHDFFSHRAGAIQRLIRVASGRASLGLAISHAVARDIAQVAPKLPIRWLENGVDTDRFVPAPAMTAALDQAAGLGGGTGLGGEAGLGGGTGLGGAAGRIRVGLVGTYANWKGHEVFLDAIAKCPTVTGYIIGGPIYTTSGSQVTETALRERARTLGIADRVGFVGFQADPIWIYQSLDIVVHASVRPEPFGLTIAEAMACGRAVVASDSGGSAELYTEMHDALGHRSGDSDSLAESIRRLAADSDLRERLGRNARQTALKRFAVDGFGRKLLDAYTSVLPA